jgi:hypothetical protein
MAFVIGLLLISFSRVNSGYQYCLVPLEVLGPAYGLPYIEHIPCFEIVSLEFHFIVKF